MLNSISANEKVLIDSYANGFFDDLNKFNEEANIYLANIIIKDIDKIYFNLVYQKENWFKSKKRVIWESFERYNNEVNKIKFYYISNYL